ncbi:MAG: cell envelope-like transcriptional attenuator [Chloroflexi bacterium OLB14]|nr:MAG: cell envelope-like transcriptional attenuator [Chloroflexi bacterium OLB14]
MSATPNRRILLFILGAVSLLCLCSTPVIGLTNYQAFVSNPTVTLPPPFIINTATNTSTPTKTPPLCGGPEAMFIVVVGSDARADTYVSGLADAIRVVRVDFVNPSMMMLPFPRDLYVEIPEISEHYNITHGKLNQAFLYGNDGFKYYDGEGKGLGLLALTLEHNFAVQVNHGVAVNLQSFVKIVDAFGGIDINLPTAIDGRVKNSIDSNFYFPAGEQHLNGYRTMILARLRPNGDIIRTQTQDLILKALFKKVFTSTTITNLPAIIESFITSVQTNLTESEIAQLLCLAPMIDSEKIQTVNFPEELFKTKRVNDPILGYTSVLDVDFAILRKYVEEFNKGSWLDTIPQP